MDDETTAGLEHPMISQSQSHTLALLPEHDLRKTGPVDEADWNYRPVLNYISRQRFELVLELLDETPANDLLEIGYGSGVFAPELARRAKALWGIDIHPFHAGVTQTLARHGIRAQLTTGSIEHTPYPDDSFDVAVAVSALEFVADLDATCVELQRILRPGGVLVAVAPQSSRVLDALLFAATRERAAANYENRRELLFPTLERYFTIERHATFPDWTPVGIYRAVRMRPRT